MADELNRTKQDRAFLHDLATPMTIFKLTVTKIAQKLTGPESKLSDEDKAFYDKLLQRALNSAKKLEEFHANHRAVLAAREVEDAGKKAS